jgi:hypothetical protein
MIVPITTNRRLVHTVCLAPAADAWRDLSRDGFERATQLNPETNATRILDTAVQDRVYCAFQ